MVYRSRYGPKKKAIFLKNLFIDTLCSTAYFEVRKSCKVYGFNAIVTSFQNGVP